MDKNSLNEIISFSICDNGECKQYDSPVTYWIDSNDIIVRIGTNERVEFYPLKTMDKMKVCTSEDLCRELDKIGIDKSEITTLRIEEKMTNSWGLKPLLENATNTLCFYIAEYIVDKEHYIMIYNIDGTRAIESIYVHGIWQIS